jgi:hypothetical protein
MIDATKWLGAPPLTEDPHCDSPRIKVGVASAQPVRKPGARILENEALLMALPNGIVGPPSRTWSISTIRGINVGDRFVQVEFQWIKS